MKTSVLINCYNYEAFVGEAIDSVRRQSLPVDELIIVDDGSTDRSVERVEAKIADFPAARLVRKENQGQLAAFETGIREAAGDLVFFLDADDLYLPNHVAAAVEVFQADPQVGFYFCAHRRSDSGAEIGYKRGCEDLGPSAILTYLISAYVGSITSAIVMRRNAAASLFPLAPATYPEWVTEADNCLIFGASLTGCRKYFNPEPGLEYRIHGMNNFAGRTRETYDRYLFHLRRHRLLMELSGKFGMTPDVARRLHVEFRCIPRPNRALYRDYCKALRHSRLRLVEKLSIRLKLFSRYYGAQKSAQM